MSNLPERLNVDLATVEGQAVLFEDSNQLLGLTDAQLRHLAALTGDGAKSELAQMRRRFGLLAWAGWLRFEGKPYEEYVKALGAYVGVNPRTVKAWRDAVIEKGDLAVPPATDQRRQEAAARPKKSRSKRVRAENLHGNKVIPVDSTELPDQKSEEEKAGDSRAPSNASSGPLPEGDAQVPQPAPPSGPALSGRGSVAPPTERNQTERLPTNRALASRVVAAMQEVEPTDAGPVLTPEEATFLRQWAQRALDAWRAKHVPTNGVSSALRPAGRSARAVPPPPLPAKTHERKRHGEGCSCYGCKPPKAAAK